jgi:DNA-directed RNA polymerase subunit RPC12/RpoP
MTEKSPLARAVEGFRTGYSGTPAPTPQGELSPLITCPDCGSTVSRRAAACPKCGAPLQSKIDREGLPCPRCGNRNSWKYGVGCGVWILALFTFGLAFFALLFMPRRWHCEVCGNEWRV